MPSVTRKNRKVKYGKRLPYKRLIRLSAILDTGTREEDNERNSEFSERMKGDEHEEEMKTGKPRRLARW